jgi:hypothetical protein
VPLADVIDIAAAKPSAISLKPPTPATPEWTVFENVKLRRQGAHPRRHRVEVELYRHPS